MKLKNLMMIENIWIKFLLDGHKKANEYASNKLKKIHEIVGF